MLGNSDFYNFRFSEFKISHIQSMLHNGIDLLSLFYYSNWVLAFSSTRIENIESDNRKFVNSSILGF